MTQPFRLLAAGLILSLGALAATSSRPAHGAPSSRDVVVANTAADPALVRVVRSDEDPARQPFQQKERILLADGACCDNAFVTVPPGKRLVFEYVSAAGIANGSQSFTYEVGAPVNGEPRVTHYLPVTQQINDGNTTAIAGQQVRLYADGAGGSVMLRAGRSGGGEATIWMTVSGHLVDVP
jgi:hypothetical protein